MRSLTSKIVQGWIAGMLTLTCAWPGGPATANAQQSAVPSLMWDAMTKEMTPATGLARAEFKFSVTNVSDAEVIIDRVTPSCGCTLAEMPSQPWHLAPRAHGEIAVSVDLAGKTGTLNKFVTVVPENLPPESLTVVIHLPDILDVARSLNQQMAVADRQAVFKGDCARCHTEPAHGKMAKELYLAACGICHEAKPRATMVPDLKTLAHPNDYAYWKMMITIGKPGTLMPGFGRVAGGPLTDEQVDSLARTLTSLFPGNVPPPPPVIWMVAPGSTAAPQPGK